jgi:hypothetical protein
MTGTAILAAIYAIVPDAPSQPQRQAYRRHRPWNFKQESDLFKQRGVSAATKTPETSLEKNTDSAVNL